MKKLLLVLLAAVLIVSCQKKEQNVAPQSQDVVFGVLEVDPASGLKSTEGNWDCKDGTPDYAEVKISGETYYPEVFRLQSNGRLYTQAIKLEPGNYTVQRFILWNDVGDDDDMSNDEIIMATPKKDTEYAPYVAEGLNIDITVGEFTKLEYEIDVLCFQEKEYDKFGFDWFLVGEIVIREQCFFGDICLKDPSHYMTSWYDTEQAPIGQTAIDMPAIFKIVASIKAEGESEFTPLLPTTDFTNANDEHGWGAGYALCVEYADNLNIDEEFKFELWIYVATGSTFDYVKFHEWTFKDAEMIDSNVPLFTEDDGVVDFVLGSCNLSGTDLQLAPYQNLPVQVQLNIQSPGELPSYWDFVVLDNSTDDNTGYDFGNISTDKWLGWCGDKDHGISPGTHWFNVYSSLQPLDWENSNSGLTVAKVSAINWLFNHLDQYETELGEKLLKIEDLTSSDAGTKLQDVIWYILNGTVPGDPLLKLIGDTAMTHTNYIPLPGGYAAVFLVKDGKASAQLLFVQVDP